MMSAPQVLLLDEPSLGLSPLLCGELFRSLAHIKDTGHITGADTAEALANDPKVREAYLGAG